jgi:hypothetical protein
MERNKSINPNTKYVSVFCVRPSCMRAWSTLCTCITCAQARGCDCAQTTHTHTHSHSHSHTHTHTHSHTHTHTTTTTTTCILTHSLTHTYPLTHSHTLTLTHSSRPLQLGAAHNLGMSIFSAWMLVGGTAQFVHNWRKYDGCVSPSHLHTSPWMISTCAATHSLYTAPWMISTCAATQLTHESASRRPATHVERENSCSCAHLTRLARLREMMFCACTHSPVPDLCSLYTHTLVCPCPTHSADGATHTPDNNRLRIVASLLSHFYLAFITLIRALHVLGHAPRRWGNSYTWCDDNQRLREGMDVYYYYFFISKYLEYLDSVLLILNRK